MHNPKSRWLAAFWLFLAAAPLLPAQEVLVSPLKPFEDQQPFDQPPVIKGKFAPAFPREMKPSGEIGYVIVMVYLDDKGKNRSRWVEGTVHPYKDSVSDAVTDWRVQPAQRGGKPVDSRFWLSVVFNPPSSAGNLPDATPRLLEASPIYHPDKKAEKAITVPATMKISDQGRAENIVVAAADAPLQAAVERAVASWKFSPARKAGQPQPAELTLAVLVQPRLAQNIAKATPPIVIRQSPPEYPMAMRYSGLRGEVTVEFVVTTTGEVGEAKVLESNNPGFNEAAMEAIRKWKFKPSRMGDTPINAKMRQQIVFEMMGGGDAFTVEKNRRKGKPAGQYDPDITAKPRGVVLPVYPYEMLRSRTRGSAEVRMVVDEMGRMYEVTVVKSTHPEFGQALAAAVQAFAFDPALKQGKPIPSALTMTYEFKARDTVEFAETDLLDEELKHPEKIVVPKSVEEVPKAISRPGPAYPLEFARTGETGSAVVEFLIDHEGKVRLPRIVSATKSAFGYAAVQAIYNWRFEEPRVAGKPAVLRVRMPMEFSLGEK